MGAQTWVGFWLLYVTAHQRVIIWGVPAEAYDYESVIEQGARGGAINGEHQT